MSSHCRLSSARSVVPCTSFAWARNPFVRVSGGMSTESTANRSAPVARSWESFPCAIVSTADHRRPPIRRPSIRTWIRSINRLVNGSSAWTSPLASIVPSSSAAASTSPTITRITGSGSRAGSLVRSGAECHGSEGVTIEARITHGPRHDLLLDLVIRCFRGNQSGRLVLCRRIEFDDHRLVGVERRAHAQRFVLPQVRERVSERRSGE
jgi:hypothetical protein